jgi:DNA replication protein DnaC
VARGEGVFQKVISAYKKIDLLILDEWLLTPLSVSESRDLPEIVESRYSGSSTIFSSQFDVSGWLTKITETPIAEAILDRIVHILLILLWNTLKYQAASCNLFPVPISFLLVSFCIY